MEPHPQNPEAHSSLASDLVLRALERQAAYLASNFAPPYVAERPDRLTAYAVGTHFARYILRIPSDNQGYPQVYQFTNEGIVAAHPPLPPQNHHKAKKLIEIINTLYNVTASRA